MCGVLCCVFGTLWRAAANSLSTQHERQMALPICCCKAHRTATGCARLINHFALWPSPSGYLEVANFDGSALSFGSNDVVPSPAALFIAALRRSRTPKMYATRPQNSNIVIANSRFRGCSNALCFLILSICVLKSLCRTHLVGKVPLATHLRNPASSA